MPDVRNSPFCFGHFSDLTVEAFDGNINHLISMLSMEKWKDFTRYRMVTC